MKSLAALAPFSLLGLGGTLYTAIVMAIRYFDGSYSKGGKFFEAMALAARPVFNSKGTTSVLSSKLFVLVSMLSTSFIAHYNAPAFYNELKDTSMPRFNKVVSYAFVASIITFVFMMSLGFLTFGGATAGFVLNNYSGSDNLITFARLAIGLALLTGYPFTFAALRDGILDLQKVSGEARSKAFQPLTLGLLTVITTIALLVKDVGFVVSVSGALFGSALMFVVPAVMNIKNLKAIADKAKSQLTSNNKLEIAFNWGMIVTGIVMGALGVIISTLKQFGKM
jgi:sodium-coupled neutral amino acid transporter 11